MQKEELYEKLNSGIIEEKYRTFKINLRKNLPMIEAYGGLRRVVPFFEGKNIVIAGAGPSLDRQIDVLCRYHKRPDVVLIAADMALRPLMKQGIIPDYAISCETTPVDFFKDVDSGKIHLLAFSCMSNINLRKWTGDISFYNWMINHPDYNFLWEKAGYELGSLATGNTVTTQAVSLALGCNINSLMLVGNDLGFASSYYAKESVIHMRHLKDTNRIKPVSSLEVSIVRKRREYEIRRGNRCYFTDSQFLTAKYWLEELFAKHSIKIFDSSEPGCSETSVIKSELEDYFRAVLKKKQRGRRRS